MYNRKYLKKNYSFSPVNLLLSLGVLLLTFGCTDTKDKYGPMYFGGKIINPLGEYVYFSKNERVIDSAKIDKQNKFSFYLDSMQLGLYTFQHGPEFQYLYLEPKDSLLIYLNTWDFDESIIYSGTQAKKNNYLISTWLQQEDFGKSFEENYGLNEKEFLNAIDVELKKQLTSYDNLIEEAGEAPSALFEKLAKAQIYYPFYYLKEHYPFRNKRILKLDSLPKLSEDFYSYRSTIALNDNVLRNYGPHYSYVLNYLNLKAKRDYLNDPKKNNYSLNYMKIVNDEITNEKFKNKLLAWSFWGCLTSNYMSDEDFKEVSNYFFENCTDTNLCSENKKLVKQKALLKQGEKLPEVIVYNVDGEEVVINNIIDSTDVVLYFWPENVGRAQMLNEKLASLQKEYPDLLFIGIERDKTHKDWVKFIGYKKLSNANQFMLAKNSINDEYFSGDMSRTIIVKSDGYVYNGYLFFTDKNFDHQLKKLNNQ